MVLFAPAVLAVCLELLEPADWSEARRGARLGNEIDEKRIVLSKPTPATRVVRTTERERESEGGGESERA